MSYPIETKLCSKNGYHTPEEARAYYGRYDRHGITWHWWGLPSDNPDSAHSNIVNYIYNKSLAGTGSVNWVLSNMRITLMVGNKNVAWTSQGGNPVTVSVELSPNLNAEGYKKAGWLASQIAAEFGGDRQYYPHNYWFATQCPGTVSLDRIRQEEDKWQRGEYNSAPAPAPTPTWNYVPEVGKAIVQGTDGDGLWVLKSPQLGGQTVTVVNEGTMMDYEGYVTNGDSVNGNRKWWKNKYGNYFSAYYAPKYVAPAPTPEPTPKPPPTPVPLEPILMPVQLTKMYTLANAKLVNIKDMSVIKEYTIDTPMDIAGESTWTGNKFFITKSSMDGNRATGFLVGDLKLAPEPAPIPEPILPEWVKNLRDIDDTKYWTKRELTLTDIKTGQPYIDPRTNDVVRFEKDHEFVGSALTKVGTTEYRITDYSYSQNRFVGIPIDDLTLTPPDQPDIDPIPDYGQRLDALEALVQKIIDILKSLKFWS